MKYCFRCGKEFARKDSLNRHLIKFEPCYPKFLNIDGKELKQNYAKYEKKYLGMINKYESVDVYMTKKYDKNDMEITCDFCGKIFKFKNNYYVHKKRYCKQIKLKKENDTKMKELYHLLVLREEEKENIKKEIREQYDEEIKKLQEQITNLRSQLKVKNSNNDNSTISSHNDSSHNNSHNNIMHNSNNNNVIITINDYGKEDYSKITEDECRMLIESDFDIILKLVELVHIDDPENMNIYIASLKEKYAMILRDQEWSAVDRMEFLRKLMMEKSQILHDLVDKYEKKFTKSKVERIRKVIDMSVSDEEETDKIISNIQLLLYNKNKLIRENYRTRYHERIKAR